MSRNGVGEKGGRKRGRGEKHAQGNGEKQKDALNYPGGVQRERNERNERRRKNVGLVERGRDRGKR